MSHARGVDQRDAIPRGAPRTMLNPGLNACFVTESAILIGQTWLKLPSGPLDTNRTRGTELWRSEDHGSIFFKNLLQYFISHRLDGTYVQKNNYSTYRFGLTRRLLLEYSTYATQFLRTKSIKIAVEKPVTPAFFFVLVKY
jgi:hypothetical protein